MVYERPGHLLFVIKNLRNAQRAPRGGHKGRIVFPKNSDFVEKGGGGADLVGVEMRYFETDEKKENQYIVAG